MSDQPTWLITGGAGYIGAHIVRTFRGSGRDVVVLDDLSTGFRHYVPDDVPFVEGSLTDADAVRRALVDHDVSGVVHLGAWKYAGLSVEQPLHFYRRNVTGTQTLLEGMVECDVNRMLFSSSCSVYGTPNVDVVNEQTATGPESPYGETKLVSEWIIRDVARVRSQFRHTSLRYFNVVGSGSPEIADQSPHNLFPLVLRALTEGRTPMIWGGDYPTRDRTCVRDYIHVVDLAEAHLAAAERLESDQPAAAVYNVGRGEGSTVREVMETIGRVTGIDFQPEVRERRPGDPAHIVASADLIERDLGWEARLGLEDMVASAWQSWRHNVELQAERLDVSS